MVRLVVNDDDVLLVAQARGRRGAPSGPASRVNGSRSAGPGQDRLGELAGRDLLAQLEGVEVGDHDLGLAELLQQVGRHEVALAVVVVRVVGQQHAQPVADGDAGRDDQERVARSGRPAGWPAC